MNRTRRLWSSAVAAAVVAAVLAGCSAGTHPDSSSSPGAGGGGATGPGSSSPAQSGASITTTTMTPAGKSSVDKVTWNVFEGEPQTLDPYKSADYTPNTINSNMCETLLAQKPDYSIQPNLAESFTNPDPLHWVYTLRSDVTFWDGSPMTAEDVAWSLNHNLTDKTTFYNYLYSNVKSIAVTGAHQVTITLSHPDYLLNDELSSYAGVVVEKKFFQAHATDFGSPNVGVMCTGPFEFVKWTKGQSITLKKNPNYWNKELQPKVKTLVFTFLTDPTAITSGLLTGQIDGTYNAPWASLDQLTSTSAGKLYYGPATLNTTMVYANPNGATSNLKVREALQIATDWDSLIKTVYHGAATMLRGSAPPTVFGSAKSQLQPGYDKLPAPQSAQYAQAKKLVAQVPASVRNKTITMVVPASTQSRQIGLAVESGAEKIGLKFTLKVVPPDTYGGYLYDPKTRAGIDILYTVFWPNIPNALDWFGITAVKGGSFNQYGYTGVDALYRQAVGTKDLEARAKIMVQIQAKLRAGLLPMAPGIDTYNTVWMNKRITGAPASFDYVYYPWAAYLGGA